MAQPESLIGLPPIAAAKVSPGFVISGDPLARK
jgi:hypothetical protein